MTAVAIFVKTPGLSLVKTRLAEGIGSALATEFHRRAALAVAAVARAAGSDILPYWAVAEHEAMSHSAWSTFPKVWQGDGGLGMRLDQVYAALLKRHGSVLLIGADAPQVTPALLRNAARTVRDGGPPYAIGSATDGGFWLFGGRASVPAEVWRSVVYSQADTGAMLAAALRPFGAIGCIPPLADTDQLSDLPGLASALQALSDPLPEQTSLGHWLQTVSQSTAYPNSSRRRQDHDRFRSRAPRDARRCRARQREIP